MGIYNHKNQVPGLREGKVRFVERAAEKPKEKTEPKQPSLPPNSFLPPKGGVPEKNRMLLSNK